MLAVGEDGDSDIFTRLLVLFSFSLSLGGRPGID